MAEQQIQTKTKKGVKKRFFEISAPLTATKIHLYAADESELNNKTIRLDLTKSLRGKSLELKFRIKHENNELTAIPESIELAGSYVRRAMRSSTDYVEDSFEVECRDATARIKPLLITRKRVSRAVLKALRDETKKQIEAHVKTRTAQEIFSDIIANKLQKLLAVKLKKIYPLALCEIRVFQIAKLK